MTLLTIWVVAVAACSGGEEAKEPAPRHERRPVRFHPTIFRAGNSLEGYTDAAKAGCRFGESDFRLTADGVLVSTHNVRMEGNCGSVDRRTREQLGTCSLKNDNHVATLADFLALPFEGWFIDLKDTESKDDGRVLESVRSVIAEIERADLRRKVVVMIYRAPGPVLSEIRSRGIRAGMKGYPGTREQTLALVDLAHRNGFEMVCVKITNITPEIIDLSARKGVWHLAWDLGRHEDRWRNLARAGLGGVITRHPLVADREASPCYLPPAGWVDQGPVGR